MKKPKQIEKGRFNISASSVLGPDFDGGMADMPNGSW